MANGTTDSQAWDSGRSPGRGGGGDLPRRSSRSRSPGRGNGDDRKYALILTPPMSVLFLMTQPAVKGDRILATTFTFPA